MSRKYKPPICRECRKYRFNTEARARGYIGYLLRRQAPKRGTFALAPYRCHTGPGWHVGRDPAVLMIDFTKGRIWPIRTTAKASDASPAD